MRFNLDNHFGVQEQAMMLRSQRAQVLAENLANADTPNYKAKDLDFKAAFDQANGEINAGKLARTNSMHISQDNAGAYGGQLIERKTSQPSMDGNTVDTQVEQSAFLRNAIEYQVSLRFLSGKIKGLMSAIRGE